MSKQSDEPSPTKTDSSGNSIIDPPGYIQPELQDLLLTDLATSDLNDIARTMEVDYLGPTSLPGTFPAIGCIWGRNRRLMVPLVCRLRTNKHAPSVIIIFLIDTGSPVTYICQEAMEAMLEKDSYLPKVLYVKIQSGRSIQCHLSPKDHHFANVNVLGMDFLSENEVFPIPNWSEKSFSLK